MKNDEQPVERLATDLRLAGKAERMVEASIGAVRRLARVSGDGGGCTWAAMRADRGGRDRTADGRNAGCDAAPAAVTPSAPVWSGG